MIIEYSIVKTFEDGFVLLVILPNLRDESSRLQMKIYWETKIKE